MHLTSAAKQQAPQTKSSSPYLPLLAALVLLLAAFNVRAQSGETRIIDHMIFDKWALTSPKAKWQPTEFEVKPDLGPVWVVLHYIGKPTSRWKDGTASFEVMPEGVKVNMRDSFMLFQSQYMADYVVDPTLTIQYGDKSRVLTQSDLKKLMTREDYQQYREAINAEIARTKDWRQLVQVNYYNIPFNGIRGQTTQISVTPRTLEDMESLNLEVIVGQGPIPPKLKENIGKKNGSWFYRYRMFLVMIGTFAVGAFWLWRRI